MNFEFSQEQIQLRESVQKMLDSKEALKKAREVLEGDNLFDEDLWNSLIEMGLTATTIPEEYEGLGLGHLELCVVAEELGRSLAPTPFSSSVYIATEAILLLGSDTQKQEYLPKLARGEIIGTLAHSESLTMPTPENIKTISENEKITGTKIVVPDGNIADFAITTAVSSGNVGLYLVDLKCSEVNIVEQVTIDPSRSHASIEFNEASAQLLGSLEEGWSGLEKTLDKAAILFAFEQLGGAEACMNMAKEYSLGRFAFGRPIGSFQAIKHKLADMFVAVELARSNCYFGAWALSSDAAELPTAAAASRVSASDAFYECSKENIQTHGGMGFTWEFDCHLFYKRYRQLAANIGSQAVWKDKLITSLERANKI